MDRDLLLRWGKVSQRWEVWRRNPIKRHLPPEIVCTWCKTNGTKYGSFLPLDNRLIDWLLERDMARKFKGRDMRYVGALMEKELCEIEAKEEAGREKARGEIHDELRGKLRTAAAADFRSGRMVLPEGKKGRKPAVKNGRKVSYYGY